MSNNDRKLKEQAFRELRQGGPEAVKQKARKSRARTVARVVALAAAGAVAGVIGLAWSKLHVITKGNPISIFDTIGNPRGKFPGKDRVTVLLIGKDYNYNSKGMPSSKESRSDSIMLLSLDLKNKKINALSIPRDTYVRAPDGKTGKINGTYARGGQKLLRETIASKLGVTPDYFVAIKPDAMKAVVDKLGGVEVETIDRMEYNDSWGKLHVDLPKGKQTINGTQAIGFARYRHADLYERTPDGMPIYTGRKDRQGNPIFKMRHPVVHSEEDGDARRMARQQQLIRAMANKGKSFGNLLQLEKIVETGLAQIETDMKDDQIIALAALFRSIQPEQMQGGSLPGEGHVRGTWFFFLDEEKSRAMVDWLIRGKEEAANSLTVVAVQNGTKVPGAASKVMRRLREEGYDARNSGNAQKTTVDDLPATKVVYTKASVLPRAKRIASLIGGGTLVKDPKPDKTGMMGLKRDEAIDVKIVLGRDLAEQYGAQSASRH
jgi:LCP family protein required for cell wall assembly